MTDRAHNWAPPTPASRSTWRKWVLTELKTTRNWRRTRFAGAAAGADVLRSAPLPFTGVLPDALSALDAETLARLEQDLSKLIALLEADESSANVMLSQM